MTTIQFRSPVLRPVLRLGTPKPVPPDPRAYETFRVTQTFGSLDGYYKGVAHGATDIGNFRCGDAVVAMAAGFARRVQDNAASLGALSNALGVVIDHGNGLTTEYWHLNAWTIPAEGKKVMPGEQIGVVGRTGLGNVCHVHIEAKRNGQRFDPEPLIFGGSVELGDTSTATGAPNMKISGAFARHIQNRQGQLTSGSNFREGVLAGSDDPIGTLPEGTLLYPVLVTKGRAIGTAADRAEWYGAWAYTAGAYHFGYVHSSVLPRTTDKQGVALSPIEADGAASDEELQDAREAGTIAERKRWLSWHDAAPGV